MTKLSNPPAISCLAATNHSKGERQKDDFYATEPRAVDLLLEKEQFSPEIWECACGAGHIGKVLENNGYHVRGTDLVYRGYGEREPFDFLGNTEKFDGDIITNPPYKIALDFVKAAIDAVTDGHKVAMFLKLLFLEGKARKKFFEEHPPRTVYVSSSRLNCAKNGDFETYKINSCVAYAWFVWEKGYKGPTEIKWIN